MPPPPLASNDIMYSFLLPDLGRGRDETYRRRELITLIAVPRLSVIRVLVLCQSTKCKFWWYYDYPNVFDLWAIEPTRFRLITWLCDLDLWPWRSWRLWLMWVVVLHRYTRFEVRRPCHSEAIWRTMCQHGPGDPDLWPFDLEISMRVALRWGTRPSKFGHAKPLGYRIIRYVRDRRTDRRGGASRHTRDETARGIYWHRLCQWCGFWPIEKFMTIAIIVLP